MHTCPALELILRVSQKARFKEHINPMRLRSCFKEREIEEVSVKCRKNCGFDILDVRKESSNDSRLEQMSAEDK